MLYVLAVIGAVTVAALLWRALGPDRVGAGVRGTTTAPDDDPEFLRKLAERTKKRPPGDEELPPAP